MAVHLGWKAEEAHTVRSLQHGPVLASMSILILLGHRLAQRAWPAENSKFRALRQKFGQAEAIDR